VKGRVDGKLVPIPPSQETVNTLFDANVHSEEEMEARAPRALRGAAALEAPAPRCVVVRRKKRF
jgi:hypothetical protein